LTVVDVKDDVVVVMLDARAPYTGPRVVLIEEMVVPSILDRLETPGPHAIAGYVFDKLYRSVDIFEP